MALKETEKKPEWLSTHPNNETRYIEMERLIEQAMELRKLCQV